MASYARDAVDDFDEYDPTPYGGGYDQAIAYGRPNSPSEETCYPPAQASDHSSSHHFSYGSESSPYGAQRIDEDRPTYGSGSTHSYEESAPQTYGSGYGSGGGSSYESHGRPKPQPAYGFQPNPDADQYSERPPQRFGGEEEDRPSYGRQEPQQGYGGRWNKPQEDQSGYADEYGEQRTEGWKPSYDRPGYQQEEEPSRFERPSYYKPDQEEGYQRPQYGDDYEKPRHGHHHHHHKHYDEEWCKHTNFLQV